MCWSCKNVRCALIRNVWTDKGTSLLRNSIACPGTRLPGPLIHSFTLHLLLTACILKHNLHVTFLSRNLKVADAMS